MASAFDDEDLALSINTSHTRRGSTRGPGDRDAPQHPELRHDPRLALSDHTSGSSTSTSNSLHKPSARLGEYNIIRTLGEGSFGKVKLAIHARLGHKVALKIISRRKLMARDMQGRIEREIQYLQLLRHPHIIKLFTVITTPADIVMVLEYAGTELFNYIVDQGKLEEAYARQFFQQIVCAVEYCHRHKIVHRDLKPENLLLDEQFNVKIADFGLSNIMTDGNFLKTSCGSPNYAAPEVISGKLYAGPEVDVWSCGVILYVLLTGRLPFDDDYIPALFKKIALGQYAIPEHVSAGALRLIRKMLQVSPVNRITIAEIRQDPWFRKDLAEYLQPPIEDFLDTGVDPTKAIDPKSLAPNKSAAVVAKLHDSVVGKLGKTMGYGKEDVQHALAIDEPNAIKDAYLIVRENQIMRETPSLAKDPNLQPFLATSPPSGPSHSIAAAMGSEPSGLPERPRHSSMTSSSSIIDPRTSVSTVAVLPSSLPDYHQASMKGEPPPPEEPTDKNKDETPYNEQSKEQQAAIVRRLKPHNRSQLKMDKVNRPEALTPLAPVQKKSKPIKWQFGIRSRNQPAEAMLAIYKALKATGATWEVPKARKPGRNTSEGDSGQDEGSGIESSSGSEDEKDEHDDSDLVLEDENNDLHRTASKRDSVGSSTRGRGRSRYGSWNDWGYNVSQDPWIINARFRKEDMNPPGATAPLSASSSRVDLQDTASVGRASNDGNEAPQGGRKRASSGASSTAASVHHGQPDAGSTGEQGTQKKKLTSHSPLADDSAYVYMTIQLYSIEKEFYLVDFKCSGYERLVRRLVREVKDDLSSPPSDDEDDESRFDRGTAENKWGPGNEVHVGSPPRNKGHWDEMRRARREKQTAATGIGINGEQSGEEDEYGGTRSGIRLREEEVGDGRAVEEKDVSSPFPFLDIASRLIIQLAEAD